MTPVRNGCYLYQWLSYPHVIHRGRTPAAIRCHKVKNWAGEAVLARPGFPWPSLHGELSVIIILIQSHPKNFSTAAGMFLHAFSSPLLFSFPLLKLMTESSTQKNVLPLKTISSEVGGAFIILIFPCLYRHWKYAILN